MNCNISLINFIEAAFKYIPQNQLLAYFRRMFNNNETLEINSTTLNNLIITCDLISENKIEDYLNKLNININDLFNNLTEKDINAIENILKSNMITWEFSPFVVGYANFSTFTMVSSDILDRKTIINLFNIWAKHYNWFKTVTIDEYAEDLEHLADGLRQSLAPVTTQKMLNKFSKDFPNLKDYLTEHGYDITKDELVDFKTYANFYNDYGLCVRL